MVTRCESSAPYRRLFALTPVLLKYLGQTWRLPCPRCPALLTQSTCLFACVRLPRGGDFTQTLSSPVSSSSPMVSVARLIFGRLHCGRRGRLTGSAAGERVCVDKDIQKFGQVRRFHRSHVRTAWICEPVPQTPVFGSCRGSGRESQTYAPGQGDPGR